MDLPPLVHMETDGKEDYGLPAVSSALRDSGPKYPYGLCLRLEKEQLEKLDLDEDCDVGDEICFIACAKVTSVSQRETQDGNDMSVELQITDIGIVSMEDEPEEYLDYDPAEFYEKRSKVISEKLYDHNDGEY